MSKGRVPLLARLGRFTATRRRLVLWASVVVFAVAAGFGAGAKDHLSSGGFDAPRAESTEARRFVDERFGGGTVDAVLLVTAREGDVDSPAVRAAGGALTREVAQAPGVESAESYWTLGNARPLRSNEGNQALVLLQLAGTQDEAVDALEELSPRFTRAGDVVDVEVTGYLEVFREANHRVEQDLLRAEMIFVPITALLLLFVFRSVVAAALPLVVGGLAIVGTMFVLRVVAATTEVSVFALNMATGLGFGLGIDYSLFMVSRFREELDAGYGRRDATIRTVATAGRTVLFSAVTVGASLLALVVFPLAFLRSFAYTGIAVAAIAGLAAVVTLPAVLAALGPGIDRWAVRRARDDSSPSGWRRTAAFVLRRPVPIATAGVLLLLLLGVPFLRIELGMPDERVLRPGAPARQVVEEFRAGFAANEGFPILVAVPHVGDVATRTDDISRYAAALSQLEGVVRVDGATGSYAQGSLILANEVVSSRFRAPGATYLSVIAAPTIPPFSPRAEDVVRAVRSLPSPLGPVLVGGESASFVDSKGAMLDRLPLAALVIGLTTLVVLFLAFGSVLVPLKAIVLNLLSLTATFGAMVWVFQDGNLSGLLGFTPREAIDLFNPLLMFAIAFGLSMDYEVFLLSRIKEEYDRTGDNAAAVVEGVDRTGRLITAAALLMAAVYLSFATGEVSTIKLFGLGLALAILVDAFVIRATLVPALMQLAGRFNWWAPAWLRRVHDRAGFSEGAPSAPPPVAVTGASK